MRVIVVVGGRRVCLVICPFCFQSLFFELSFLRPGIICPVLLVEFLSSDFVFDSVEVLQFLSEELL